MNRQDGAARTIGRLLLGAALGGAGLGRLTTLRPGGPAPVPPGRPLDPDLVAAAPGAVELALGAALLAAPRRRRPAVGWTTAAFFVAIFPGNVAQYTTGTDAFGLDSDEARFVRLLFQPLLVAWALWSTGAWRAWRGRRAADR